MLALLGFAPRADALGLLIPAYFAPSRSAEWEALNQAARRVPLMAIINPHNGPAGAADPDYTRVVSALRQAGGLVIGYVFSSYTARPLAEVKADIDRYDEFYELDGVFIDEMTNDSLAAHLAYYAELYGHVKAKRGASLVVGNPGANTAASYLTRPSADLLVTFEDRTGYPAYVPDLWTQTQPATAFAHLCYEVASAATMTNYVEWVLARNAGYLYVTDGGGTNPWDSLPSYWLAEVGAIDAINRRLARQKPPRLSLNSILDGSVSLRVDGAPGRHVLEASIDLRHWEPVATKVSATGSFLFALSRPAAQTVSFFRVVQW